MLDERLSLNEAAELLERSPRQLRRDVRAGRLPAQGGGRGKALWFKASDLKDFRVCFDAELLARAVYGLHRLRKGENPADVFPRHESQTLWHWWRKGSPAFKFARDRFPPLASVPDAIRRKVRRICAKLSPREIDYLAGMVVCVAHPWRDYSSEELRAFDVAQAAVGDRRTRFPGDEPGFANALDGKAFSGDAAWLDEALFGDGKISQDARKRNEVFAYNLFSKKKIKIKTRNRLRWVRMLQSALHPVRGLDLRPSFMKAVRKIKYEREHIGKGRPDAQRVAALLGIERHLASKIFFQVVTKKLGRDATGEWFGLIGCPMPRVKGAGLRRRVERIAPTMDDSACRSCGGTLGEWDVFCRRCGRLLSFNA